MADGNEIRMINVDDLRANPDNPRRDVGDVTELAQSIRTQGIRQNLLVTPMRENTGPGETRDVYRVVIGHRRLAAAKLAGMRAVPCAVADLTPLQERELMLVENTQRADLTAIEEADGYQGLLDLGATVKDMAAKTGRSRSFVHQRLKVAKLGSAVRDNIKSRQPSIDVLLTLADYNDYPDLQADLLKDFDANGRITGFRLQDAESAMAGRKWLAAAKASAEHAGLVVNDWPNEEAWCDPSGHDRVMTFAPDDGKFETQWAEYLEHNPVDGTSLWARDIDGWAAMVLTRPSKDNEAEERDQRRERKENERKANRANFLKFRNAAKASRLQWIHEHILHDDGTVNDSQIEHALNGAATTMTGMALANDCSVGVIAAGTEWDRIMQGLGFPAKHGKDEHGSLYPHADDYLEDLGEHPTPRLLLASILAWMEAKSGDYEWGARKYGPTPVGRIVTSLYDTLRTCGYAASEEENMALAGEWADKPGALGIC